MNISDIKARIEKTLEDFLPTTINQNWKQNNFGILPDSVLDEHINQLVTPCKNLLNLGGKRWRPILQVLCGMMTANASDTKANIDDIFNLVPLVEFTHTASLIHDDIEDGADTRRGMAATHITYGLDTALNAGSWLYFVAPTVIDKLQISQDKKNLFYRLFLTELRRLHLGQAMDIYWHRNTDIFPTEEQYKAMVQNKTGTLSCLAVLMGILSGGGSEEQALQAANIAREIGEGFQVLDDVQNLTTGNPGKKRGDDIVEGKKSLPVIMHIKHNPNDKEKIICYFKNAKKQGIMCEDVEKCILLLQNSDSIKNAFEKGHLLVKQKTLELVRLFEKQEQLSEVAQQIIDLFESMLPKL